jgi:Prp8 binding protein
MFDIGTERKTKKFTGHEAIVNSIDVSKRGLEMIASVSDDCTIKLWDSRYKEAIHSFQTEFPVLSVCFNETSDRLFTSGKFIFEISLIKLKVSKIQSRYGT